MVWGDEIEVGEHEREGASGGDDGEVGVEFGREFDVGDVARGGGAEERAAGGDDAGLGGASESVGEGGGDDFGVAGEAEGDEERVEADVGGEGLILDDFYRNGEG